MVLKLNLMYNREREGGGGGEEGGRAALHSSADWITDLFGLVLTCLWWTSPETDTDLMESTVEET